MRTTAIVVAAGRGERAGGTLPKQFQPCAGRPLLLHTLSRFAPVSGIEAMIVVLADPRDLDSRLEGGGGLPFPVRAVRGGEDRQASVAAGLAAAGDVDLVIVHDGVRPLVPPGVIEAVLRAAATTGAALAAVRLTDTVKEVAHGRVVRTLAREQLYRAQTPQAFKADLLRRAHRRAEEDGFRGTDDACLVERLGSAVAVVESPESNLKVTTAGDLELVEWHIARAGRGSAENAGARR